MIETGPASTNLLPNYGSPPHFNRTRDNLLSLRSLTTKLETLSLEIAYTTEGWT